MTTTSNPGDQAKGIAGDLLTRAKAEIEQLEARLRGSETRIASLESAEKDARVRQAKAEAALSEAMARLAKAKELQAGQYGDLIGELFSRPSKELRDSIARTASESNTKALVVAALSIVVSIIVSLYFQHSSDAALKELEWHVSRSTARGSVAAVVALLDDKRSQFNNFSSKSDFETAFRVGVIITDNTGTIDDYATALKHARLSYTTNIFELTEWARSSQATFRKAAATLALRDPTKSSTVQDRTFSTHASTPEESAALGSWQYSLALTNERIAAFYRMKSDDFRNLLNRSESQISD